MAAKKHIEILTIPCLNDNYAYLILDHESGEVALVDVPEAEPIISTLKARGLGLNAILLTHHHDDHIMGLPALLKEFDAPVKGATFDQHRLPALSQSFEDGETFTLGAQSVQVFDVSGHTMGHIAYYLPEAHALFSGDSLMVMGCGRLFEGDPETMWTSLCKLMALPNETQIYSGHEYTASNAKFALSVEPENAALVDRARDISETRARGDDTMGATLALEKKTNPFLRARDAAEFANIRGRKDRF